MKKIVFWAMLFLVIGCHSRYDICVMDYDRFMDTECIGIVQRVFRDSKDHGIRKFVIEQDGKKLQKSILSPQHLALWETIKAGDSIYNEKGSVDFTITKPTGEKFYVTLGCPDSLKMND